MSKKSNAILTILGCGTSTGVPLPACKCEVCQSDDPRNNRTRTSAWLLSDTGTSVVLDAGPDFRQQALRSQIDHIDAVLFTHGHADHILGIEDLRGYNFIQRKAIPCYASQNTVEKITSFFSYIFEPDPEYQGGALAKLDLQVIDEFMALNIKDLQALPFALYHGNLPVTGYKLGNLAYATDCNNIPEQSISLLKGIDHLILDGLRHEPHKTHYTIEQAIKVANKLEAKNTYLIHMTHSIDYETESKKLPPNFHFCYDQMQIELII